MTVDWEALNGLRRDYQRCSEDAAQAWVEHWPVEAQEAADRMQAEAGARWLAAVHAAWPEIVASFEAGRV